MHYVLACFSLIVYTLQSTHLVYDKRLYTYKYFIFLLNCFYFVIVIQIVKLKPLLLLFLYE